MDCTLIPSEKSRLLVRNLREYIRNLHGKDSPDGGLVPAPSNRFFKCYLGTFSPKVFDFDKLETEEDVPPPKPVIVNSLHSILKKSLQSPCDYMSTDCLGTIRPYCVWDRTLLSVSVKVYNLLRDLCKIYYIQSYDVGSEKEDLRIWVHDIITGEKTQKDCLEELREIVTDSNLIEDYDVSGIRKCEIRSKASCYSAYPRPTGWYCNGSGSFMLSYEYIYPDPIQTVEFTVLSRNFISKTETVTDEEADAIMEHALGKADTKDLPKMEPLTDKEADEMAKRAVAEVKTDPLGKDL